MSSARNPGLAWHPVRMLTRSDASLRTIYHSFFLVETVAASSQEIRVRRRIPEAREDLNDVESALTLFILDIARNLSTKTAAAEEEGYGSFVLTTSDAHRYYASWRGLGAQFFVSISALPLVTFSRSVLELLGTENLESIYPVLLSLCESPIFPACGLQYELKFTHGSVPLKFSGVEQVDDNDIFAVAMQLLSPRMLVTAWESIVLERKVLVMSSVPSLVPPVCEFLRRMALPFVVVNTYVPFLPEALITAVEAPFPYLLGADTHMLHRNRVDLSDSVVFDLDKREVTVPKCDTGAPNSIKALMFEDITRIVSSGLGAWIQRPCSNFAASSATSLSTHPLNSHSLNAQANAILQVFIRQNLLLIGARNCWVRGLYRRPTKFKGVDVFGFEDDRSSRIMRAENMGYHSPSNQLTCGFLQLHRQCGRLPCWVESDEIGISVYQWADQLPLLFFPYKGLQSISPCSMEPEGHIFEIVLKSQSLYRFQSTDQESRGKWISRIDSLITQANKDEDSGGVGGGGGETSGTAASGGGGGSGLPSPNGDGAESATSHTHGFFAEDGLGFEGKFDSADDHLLEEDERSVTKFRSLFLQTQMASFLESQMEGVGFVSVLQKLGYNAENRKVDEDTFSSDGDDFLISNPPLTTVLSVLNKVQECELRRTNSSGSTISAASYTATTGGGEGENRGGGDSGESERGKSELPLPTSAAGSSTIVRLSDSGHSAMADHAAKATAAAQAQEAAVVAAPAAVEQERKSIVKKRGFFNSIFNRTSKDDIETTTVTAAQPLPPSPTSAVAHTHSEAISHADADANEISRHNMRSLLSRIATSHKLSTGELQSGLTEIRIEIIAALVQYHANVVRGDEQIRPIEIQINRTSSSPPPTSSAGDSSSNGAADAQGKAGAAWFKLIWDALGVTSSESVGGGGGGGVCNRKILHHQHHLHRRRHRKKSQQPMLSMRTRALHKAYERKSSRTLTNSSPTPRASNCTNLCFKQ